MRKRGRGRGGEGIKVPCVARGGGVGGGGCMVGDKGRVVVRKVPC